MKKAILSLVLLTLLTASYAQVAVNTDGSTADNSAMLDVKSTTRGMLIPRMTATQRDAIANPVEGLMVYVTTDSTFYFYRTGGWVNVGRGSSGWNMGSPGIYTDSLVGIGTSSPNAKLAVYDNNSDTALFVYNDNDNNDFHYGFVNELFSSGTGWQYGIYNKLTTSGATTSPIYALENYLQDNGSSSRNATMIRNVVFGDGDGTQTGISQQISNTGNGTHYGMLNDLEGSGTGSKYGVKNYFPGSAEGIQYGLFNEIWGSGSSAKYGVYNYIPSSAGGTHYGTYNDVPGSSNWAGYFNGRMYVSDKVGLGTDTPSASLDIANSANSIALNINTTNNDSNGHYGIFNVLSSSGDADQVAIDNYLSITGSGVNSAYACYNVISDNSTSSPDATVYNSIYGTNNGDIYGVQQLISNTGSGVHYGVHTSLYGSGTGDQYGSYQSISNTGSGKHYGNYASLSGTGSGEQYGSYNEISNTQNSDHYGYYSEVSGNGSGKHYGYYSEVSGGGSDYHYGAYNYVTGTGSGQQVGTCNYVDNSNSNNPNIGTYNWVLGSGTDSKYGSYNYLSETAGGTHYGIYSYTPGSSNWAGYFYGRMYVSDKVGFGTSSPNEQLEIANLNDNARMILSDGNASNRRALLLVSPSSTNDFSRIESYKYGTSAGGKELQFNTVGHGQITMGGHVLPQFDDTYNLGSGDHSWYGVYYYVLFAHSFAAFNSNNITNDILAHPPVVKADKIDPSSFPKSLTNGQYILTNNVVSYNYTSNYEQQVQINTLQKEVKAQQQTIEQLKQQLSEIEQLKQQLNELKNNRK